LSANFLRLAAIRHGVLLAARSRTADGRHSAPDYRRKTGGMVRDTWDDDRAAFVVRDGDYVSARWPGDAHTFARRFAEVLAERCSR
jgi:putative intracellular protease/amidase